MLGSPIYDIQDLLIHLFVEHREAVENEDNVRARTQQSEIGDLLREKGRNREMGCCRFGLTDRDRFLDAVRRVAAKDRDGLADPEDVATELGIELSEVFSFAELS